MPSLLRLGLLVALAASMLSGCDDGDDGVSLPALEAADAWAVEDGELVLSSGEESLRVGAA